RDRVLRRIRPAPVAAGGARNLPDHHTARESGDALQHVAAHPFRHLGRGDRNGPATRGDEHQVVLLTNLPRADEPTALVVRAEPYDAATIALLFGEFRYRDPSGEALLGNGQDTTLTTDERRADEVVVRAQLHPPHTLRRATDLGELVLGATEHPSFPPPQHQVAGAI